MNKIEKMPTRKLFERVKSLDESIDKWTPNEALDENEFWNVRWLMIKDYNQCYRLLMKRVFSRKIFMPVKFV